MSVVNCIKYCFIYTDDSGDKVAFVSLFICVSQHHLTRVSFGGRARKEKRVNYIVGRLVS